MNCISEMIEREQITCPVVPALVLKRVATLAIILATAIEPPVVIMLLRRVVIV